MDEVTTQPGDDARRRLDWLLATGIAVRTLYGIGMLALIPLLIGSAPLLLTLLSGSAVAEVVVGARVRVGEISWPLALAAAVPLWVLTDWLYWAAGRRWGDRALFFLTSRRGDRVQAARQVARAERMAHRLGPAGVVLAKFLPVPGPLVYAAAGTGGMRLPVFVTLNLVGTVATAALVLSLGYALGRGAIGVVEQFQQYAAALTGVLVVVVVVAVLLRRRRRAR